MSRYETLFALRYAVRVLERHGKLWGAVDTIVRLGALLSGSSAFAALVAGNASASLAAGIVFAALQGIEFAVRPAARSAESMAGRRGYASLLAKQSGLDDAGLESAYQALVAADEVIVSDSLRHIAYNDVANERGADPACLYPLTRWQRVVAWMA